MGDLAALELAYKNAEERVNEARQELQIHKDAFHAEVCNRYHIKLGMIVRNKNRDYIGKVVWVEVSRKEVWWIDVLEQKKNGEIGRKKRGDTAGAFEIYDT